MMMLEHVIDVAVAVSALNTSSISAFAMPLHCTKILLPKVSNLCGILALNCFDLAAVVLRRSHFNAGPTALRLQDPSV